MVDLAHSRNIVWVAIGLACIALLILAASTGTVSWSGAGDLNKNDRVAIARKLAPASIDVGDNFLEEDGLATITFPPDTTLQPQPLSSFKAAFSKPAPVPVAYEMRVTQAPYYWRCYKKPRLILHDSSTRCQDLDGNDAKWKDADHISLDTERCLFYVEEGEVAQSMLKLRDVYLRPGSTDHQVFKQVYCSPDFHYLENLGKYLPRDAGISILDAGANVGLASLLLLEATRFHGQVLAVDAQPNTVEVLKRNCEPSGGRIQAVQAAIVTGPEAATHETMRFVGSAKEYWGFRVEHDHLEMSDRVEYDVPTKSLKNLADMMPSKKFDWIKLDIEGEEMYLLADPESRTVLCEATCIMMELHEWFLPGCLAAWNGFLEAGCSGKEPYQHITTTGEYMLYCRPLLES